MFAHAIPNTRRIVFVVLLAMAFLIGALLAASPSEGSRVADTHQVHQGETLWSIASQEYGGDPRPHVEAIIHRNSLVDATIQPGQVLVLP
jgi:nucleoid-associated protein YgaU